MGSDIGAGLLFERGNLLVVFRLIERCNFQESGGNRVVIAFQRPGDIDACEIAGFDEETDSIRVALAGAVTEAARIALIAAGPKNIQGDCGCGISLTQAVINITQCGGFPRDSGYRR